MDGGFILKYEWLDEFLLSLPGAEKDYKAEWGWFRYMLRGKLFAAVCSPRGMKDAAYNGHDLVNLKCDPARGEFLRAAYPEILPGFYCDKRLWIAVLLDGDLSGDLLRELCSASHKLVLEKLPKYVQRKITASPSAGKVPN